MELGVYKNEPLANAVVDLWEQLSRERDAHMDRLSDLRKYLFAADTSKTENNKNGWKNKTRTPKLIQIYDNLMAQYLSALFPNERWVSFEGRTAEDMQQEDLVETYLRHKLKESNFITTARELLSDWVISGVCCAGVEHVHETIRSNVDAEREIVKYHGAKSFRVAPNDFVMASRSPNYETSPFIRRRLIPRASLLNHNNDTSFLQYDEKVLQQLHDMSGWVRDNVDAIKDIDLLVDGFNTPLEYYQSGMVEVFEFWGDFYNKDTGEYLPNHTIGVVDRMGVLWNEPNPMWNGQRPYTITGWRERPDNLYAQGPLELLTGMQYRIDHLENAKSDILDLTIHPRVDIFGDPVDDYDMGPGAENVFGVDARVQYNAPDVSALQLNNEIYNLMNLMEEMAGSPKQTAGMRTPGEKTAFEVSSLNEGAMKLFLEKTKHFEMSFMRHHLNNFYTVLGMYFSVEDTFKVLDNATDTMSIIPVSKEALIRDGNLKLHGSENYGRRNQILVDLRDGLGTLYQNERTAAHIDSLAVDTMIARELDWEQYSIIKPYSGLTEQVDGQLAMQMHQKQRQEEMGEELPPPEGEGGPPSGNQ